MILNKDVLCQDLIGLVTVLYVRMQMMMNLISSGAAFRLACRQRYASLRQGGWLLPPP